MGFQLVIHGSFGPIITGISHGREINAGVVGLNYNGVSEGSLTAVSGYQDYSTDGLVIEGKSFNSRIDLTGNNITLRNCKLSYSGIDTFGLVITGSNITVEGCVIAAPSGQSMSNPIYVGDSADTVTIKRCEIYNGCQFTTTYGTHVQYIENYGHDVSVASDPDNHPDGNEVYGGGSIQFLRNKWTMGSGSSALFDAVMNVAPYQSANPSVDGLLIQDNYMQGGQEIILLDHQAPTGDIRNVQVFGNDMDQHTNPDTGGSFGVNRALTDGDGHPILETVAAQASTPVSVVWPVDPANAVNHWVNPDGITPDHTGKIVVPPQSFA